MMPDKDIKCHLTGFTKRCYDMVDKHKCRKWVHFQGEHPQTKAVIDVWDCRDHMDHFMDIQIIQAIRQTTNTVNELRKEVDQTNAGAVVGMLGHLNQQLEAARPNGVLAVPFQKLIEQD